MKWLTNESLTHKIGKDWISNSVLNVLHLVKCILRAEVCNVYGIQYVSILTIFIKITIINNVSLEEGLSACLSNGRWKKCSLFFLKYVMQNKMWNAKTDILTGLWKIQKTIPAFKAYFLINIFHIVL